MDQTLALLLALFASIVVIVFVVRFISSRKNRLKDYTVLVLGPENSGKTTFLASLYHKLSVQTKDIGCFLRPDLPGHREDLVDLYTKLVDTEQDFPNATLEATAYPFTCVVQAGRGGYPVFRLTYVDFAGERMKKLLNPQTGKFAPGPEMELSKVDILLGIIDGQRLLAFMRKENNRLLTEDLWQMLPIMQISNKPVHFLITKWDLLEDTFTLEAILNRLLEDTLFAEFVERYISHETTIRLIPVSAVGKGFATLQGGTVQKIAGAIPHPFQVEMPFACIFPDQFKYQIDHANTRVGLLLKRLLDIAEPVSKSVLGWITFLFVQVLILFLLRSIPAPSGVSYTPNLAGQYVGRPPSSQKPVRSREQEVYNKTAALRRTQNCFASLMQKLEKRFPESNLATYFSQREKKTKP